LAARDVYQLVDNPTTYIRSIFTDVKTDTVNKKNPPSPTSDEREVREGGKSDGAAGGMQHTDDISVRNACHLK